MVTFDADFFDLSNLKGHPLQIIWLRMEILLLITLERFFWIRKSYLRSFL
ncbi:DUF5615 family PIN-like protein [Autumnicola lenta]